jgi:hypothetical protein
MVIMYLACFSQVQLFVYEQIFQDQNEVGFVCIFNLQVSVAYPYEGGTGPAMDSEFVCGRG